VNATAHEARFAAAGLAITSKQAGAKTKPPIDDPPKGVRDAIRDVLDGLFR
jgi:hypothetical protein